MIPSGWKLIYSNPLASYEDVAHFRLEGEAAVTFPMKRMRLESTRDPEDGQQANFVWWCPEQFPADIAVSWEFRPIREPGLAIMFVAADGTAGRELFDPTLAARTGEYEQYHHGEIDAFHLSYFRRRWLDEREFHICNLRKSYGFHLVAQGADPLPSVEDCAGSYRMLIVKNGAEIAFMINELPIFKWVDDGDTFGPLLGAGKIGFRQMAPLIAEYANLQVHSKPDVPDREL